MLNEEVKQPLHKDGLVCYSYSSGICVYIPNNELEATKRFTIHMDRE